MNKLNTGFTALTDDQLYHLGLTVPQNVNTINDLISLRPQLPAISTAAAALQKAMNLPAGPVREASVAAGRANLSALLTNLANALMIVPDVTEVDLAGSGFASRATPMHSTQPPAAPANLRLRTTGTSGELQVLFGRSRAR